MFADSEDDLFGSETPKSKFSDILFNANRSLVEDELDNIIERLAICEMMLENSGVDLDMELLNFKFNNLDSLESRKINLYLDHAVSIVSKNA